MWSQLNLEINIVNFLEPGAWAKVVLTLWVRSVIPWVPVVPRRRARALESIRSASRHWRLHLLLDAARNQTGVDLKRWIGGTVRRRASAVDAAERIILYLASGRRLLRKTNSGLDLVLRRRWLDNLIQSLLHLQNVSFSLYFLKRQRRCYWARPIAALHLGTQ